MSMSNLTPQKRPDRNGKIVTRHVKMATAPTGKPLPPPSSLSALSQKDFNNDDIIRESLCRYMDEWDADDYLVFALRKPRVIQTAFAKALATVSNEDQFKAAIAVLDESAGGTLSVLALDDLDFIADVARPPYGSESPHAGTTKAYTSVVTVMTQTFNEHFKQGFLDPETVDVDTYGPFLRAATITKVLGLDSRAPTSLDSHKQREHVMENLKAFSSNYPALIRITQAINRSPAPLNSHIMLEVCDVLGDQPDAVALLVAYMDDRKRFELSEFKSLLDSPSISLSSGTL